MKGKVRLSKKGKVTAFLLAGTVLAGSVAGVVHHFNEESEENFDSNLYLTYDEFVDIVKDESEL